MRYENWRIVLIGEVQGVGMRPAIVQLALTYAVYGWVRNNFLQVELMVEGESERVQAFLDKLSTPGVLPGRPHIAEISCESVQNYTTFQILLSDPADAMQSSDVPVDRVTCQLCQSEYRDIRDRRAGYGLIGCSACGPRYSLLKAMPFDRAATTMAAFTCCSACRFEYEDVRNRRYHSQTNACPKCGPVVRGLSLGILALKRGQVVGLRGLGGYQWVALACCESAVQWLRTCKGRERKPFAVMLSHAQMNQWILDGSCVERLSQIDGPIVIIPADSVHPSMFETLAPSVRMEVQSLGVMLPTSMLHMELVEQVGPLVVTSANIEGEPICLETSQFDGSKSSIEASGMHIIDHDRPICQRIDDSVILKQSTGFLTIRPARGLTPYSWDLRKAGLHRAATTTFQSVLGVGAQQKVCLAWICGDRLTLGPYIGDLSSLGMQEAALEHWNHLSSLYRFQPELVAHDLHPEFFTTHWAVHSEKLSRLQRIAVQHHRAHWLASMLEPGWLERRVVGVVWDGTGFGEDGTIWGGECLVGDRLQQHRVATLLPFDLPGGEAAIREPWRIATSMLSQCDPTSASQYFAGMPVRAVQTMITKQQQVISCTSLGRLFDAVAAMILEPELGRRLISYEGELAQLLEERCDLEERESYELPLVGIESSGDSDIRYWDWRPMLGRIMEEKRGGVAIGQMAMRFHRTLINALLELLNYYPGLPLTLSGGCFQNRVLIQLLQEAEIDKHRSVAWPGFVPVNDSAIAIGQVLAALTWQERVSQEV